MRNIVLIFDWYLGQLHQGVKAYCKQHNMLLFCSSEFSNLFRFPLGADGFIVMLQHGHPGREWIEQQDKPAVSLHLPLYKRPLPSVLPDNEAIAKMAADYFIRQDFKSYAAVYGDQIGGTVPERGQAFTNYLQAAGLPCHRLYPDSRTCYSDPKILKSTLEKIRSLPKPLAIFTGHDFQAFLLNRILKLNGIKIPEEVALLGVDNEVNLCEQANCSISSIDQNFFQQGWRAAELLNKQLNGEQVPAVIERIKPIGIVPRQSTESITTSNPLVLRALSFIHGHCLQPISVGDIAAALSIQRRTLDLEFEQELGHSIWSEVVRLRIMEVKQQLKNSSLPLKVIAENCGFSSLSHMSNCFKKHCQMTAGQFRKQHSTGHRQIQR